MGTYITLTIDFISHLHRNKTYDCTCVSHTYTCTCKTTCVNRK